MPPLRALAASLLLAVTALAPPASAAPAPAGAGPAVECAETDLPVSLGLFSQTVHGQLCLPAGAAPDTVQLLVHGATYNRRYWDLPVAGGRYSYQRDLARRGVATFAVDCVGSGDSSQPPSALITASGQSSVLHQVVGKLRSGHVLGHRFDRVVLVGHSMGSGLAVLEATSYHDVDGVVLTGFSHSVGVPAVARVLVEGLRPAVLDPVLSRRGSDPGYLTTAPGARRVFHDPGAVDPAVLDADEATKDQVPSTVVPDALALAFLSPLSRQIDVPVLLLNGRLDTLFCASLCEDRTQFLDAEQPFFAPGTPLDAFLLPDAGHTHGYALNAADYRTAVLDWTTAHFGT
ncbi:alpha/beta fold hydrolase [Actinosynnema sp. NPDC050436]|uniref:alpha/beta fold hydrolase n=1 Tax=Actinosynnema sp. NPDC050436 TaxID=3155659 RepID=UPI0033E4ACAC